MKNFIILEDDETNKRYDNKEQNFFEDMTFKEKVIFFFILSCIGYMIELGSLSRFLKSVKDYNPGKFVILYSIGNLITIFSIVIFTGWKKQIDIMSDSTRRNTSIIFMTSLFLSIIFAFTLHNKLGKFLIILTVMIQFCAYWWYSLSFIPFARTIFKKCFKSYVLEE